MFIKLIFLFIYVLNTTSYNETKTNIKQKAITNHNIEIIKSIENNNQLLQNKQPTKQDNEKIGTISIPKINLVKNIYNINSKKNNIEENVTILKIIEDKDNHTKTMIIAAHSGTGDLAYFKNLHKLNLNDTVILNYNNTNIIYKINKIYEQDKNGYITIQQKNTDRLILTTCSEKQNKQLIIESKRKES